MLRPKNAYLSKYHATHQKSACLPTASGVFPEKCLFHLQRIFISYRVAWDFADYFANLFEF